MNKIKKTIYLLNIGDYAPEITALTYPLIRCYATRIGAEIFIIKDRKFPDWPVSYEKLQIFDLAREHKNDWNIYIDSDALVHPETVDFTHFISKDTILHHGADMAALRWNYDEYFLRDGRNIGSCNWFTVASDWCVDLWRPLDISLEAALKSIYPTPRELNASVNKEHLIDDYSLSRNIARFGLKATTVLELLPKIGLADVDFFRHGYMMQDRQKVKRIKQFIRQWHPKDKLRAQEQKRGQARESDLKAKKELRRR